MRLKATDTALTFGSFRIEPSQRLLTRDDQPVQIGSRAFDLLVTLIEAGGELVSKRALTEKVWPNGFVDESALRVHIGILRKALGDGKDGQRFILNEAGRGYRFVATISNVPHATNPSAAGKSHTVALPRPLGRIIGRDDVVVGLCEQVADHRFLTIVGPGGMGKTTVAVAVADRLADRYDCTPLFIDFASVADAPHVSTTLAAMLGVVVADEDGLQTILHALSERRQLLIFDNCEHLIDAVSSLAEAILRHAPGIDILATSREPLRAEGEWIHRLSPLGLPGELDQLGSAADALQFTAVQLFVERAQALTGGYRLTDEDAPFAVEIARRLDGIPLALELAAGGVDMFGLRALAAKLDNRFSILTKGRRTAMLRHQTLRATLDWSYELLPDDEQALLRALSAFRRRFQLEDAIALHPAGEATIFDSLSNLVSKSLVAVEAGEHDVCYRLLDTTAAYAEEKLREAGENTAIALRHAQFSLSVAKRAQAAILEGRFAHERIRFTRYLDDLREALNWALSANGDVALGAAITASAGALWFQLTLLTEYRQMTARALAAIAGTDQEDTPVGMQLLTAFGQAVWHTEGPRPAMHDAFARTLELAERTGNIPYQERAHWGLWNANTLRGYYGVGFAHAEKLEALWPKGEHAIVVDRLKSRSLNYLGRQEEALQRAQRVLNHAIANGVAPAHSLAFLEPVVARTVIARAEWLLGFPDRALQEAELCIEEMRAAGHALSICYALAVAGVPIALWAGDGDLADRRAQELRAWAERHGLVFWRSWSSVCDLSLTWQDTPAPERLRDLGFTELEHLSTWGITEALPFLESRMEMGEGGWCLPELLRLQAEALHSAGHNGDAVMRLERAKASAEATGTRSWLLRIAMTEASLLSAAGQLAEAHTALKTAYDTFSEGFGTGDLRRASAMLLAFERGEPRRVEES